MLAIDCLSVPCKGLLIIVIILNLLSAVKIVRFFAIPMIAK